MTKSAAIELARKEYAARHRSTDGSGINATEPIVDRAAKLMLSDAGVVVGKRATIITGRHKGLTGTIEQVNWREAEIRLKGQPRWFGLWNAREFVVL